MSLTTRFSRILVATLLVLTLGIAATTVIPQATSAACSALPTDRGTVTATVNIQTAGTYRVWSRIKTADAAKNSYLMQIDEETCNVVVGDATLTANQWTWVDYQGGTTTSKISVVLGSGNHTFKLAGREDNVQLDRIVLTQDTSCVPLGTGDNCADPVDATAPTVTLTAPTSGATVSGTYNMTATASDASGIKQVEFYIDNTLRNTDNSAPYSYSFDSKSISNGSHSFKAIATDNSANQNTNTSASVNATISNTTTTIRAEDINQDGLINLLDVSILSSNYGKSGAAITNVRADINADGTVNLLDFSRIASKYGT